MSALPTTTHSPTDFEGFYAWTDTLKGVQYGPGCLATALPKFLDILGAKKALIVTGRSLFEKTDVVKQVEAVLREHGAYGGVFHEIGQHVPYAGIVAGIKAYKDADADVIVSVGGGSPVDASKAILYNIQKDLGGPTPRQIAIPTTLSAAEYSIGAGFMNEQGVKVAVSSQELAPAAIILDANLTLATPERLWLATGVKALDHAIENLYRPLVTPPIKHMCYAAIGDLFKYLPLTKTNPEDVKIRQKLQIASWMSLWPTKFERYSALGLSHALGHKLGAAYGIPHGTSSCLTLAPVVALQAEIASEENKGWLAGALFHLRKPSSGSDVEDIQLLSAAIQELIESLGVAATLTQYHVPKEDLPKVAELALGRSGDPLHLKVVKLLENLYD